MQHPPFTWREWSSIYRAMMTAKIHDTEWDEMDTHVLDLVSGRRDDAKADYLLGIGKARFVNHPPSTIAEFIAHNDQVVTVVRRLSASEKSVLGLGPQPMLEILAEDGWRGSARVHQLIAAKSG